MPEGAGARGAAGGDIEVAKKSTKKSMTYVSLHHHSTYSFLDGYGHPQEHVSRAAELGMDALALTEHGNVSSHPKLEQAATTAGIKPIFGCELYCGGPTPTQRKNHLTVLSSTQEGYRNLLNMISWAWTPLEEGGGKYYEPTVQGQILAKYHEGLIVMSGCSGSLLFTSLVGGKNIDPEDASFERGLKVAAKFRDLLGDAYYLETQAFPELETTCVVNQMLEEIGRKLKIPLVATQDVHYCMPEDNIMQTILHAVRPGNLRTVEEQARSWGYDILLSHPQSDREVFDKLRRSGLSKKAANEAIASTAEIASRCNVVLPKAPALAYPLPDGIDNSGQLLRKWLKDGWNFRGISGSIYSERLKYEVDIIEQKGFVDYFLFVSDMTRWAKDNGIFVGPARGSAAASLVCYLLRITEVDPMIFPDLIFERFIDITRQDLPDIDLDFDDQRRHEVVEYLSRRYGSEKVRMLGTFTTYKSKNSLDDVARVYDIPSWEIEKVKELLIERSSGDLRASATIEDTAEMFPEVRAVFDEYPDLQKSTRLEGMVKGMGKHAAGALVSNAPLTDTCAIYGETVAVDKYDAEYLNLLKVDLLGLSNCGMLATACDMLGQSVQFFYDLPLDDEDTIQGFQDNDVVGIFQFDGRAMRLVNNALKPDNFYEVCIVNALARPGPLHNNSMSDYVDVKHGLKQPEVVHPLFEEITGNTHGQVVYQEQVLRIVREIGGFDWTAAAYIRKIISRKIGDQEFNRQWGKFWEGAQANGIDQKTAEDIWGLCITAGSYAFNAAHSVSYGLLGYWTMWLKRHHPEVFYCSALRRLPNGVDKRKHLDLMRDAVRHGIKVLPPDPATSDVSWTVSDGVLRAGFEQIPGIGEKMGQVIVEHREAEGLNSWADMINVKGIGPKTLENILAWLGDGSDPLGVHLLDRTMNKIKKQISKNKIRQENGAPLPMPTHSTAEVPFGRGKDTQVVWMGVATARNLRDLFEVNSRKTGVPLDPSEVDRPELREWVLMYATDGDETLTLRFDRFRYPDFKEAIWDIRLGKDIIMVSGVKKGYAPQKIVDVRRLWVFEP